MQKFRDIFCVAESHGVPKRDARREVSEAGRKDTFSLGTKKRNGRSLARWRKVGCNQAGRQALTEAKETLRAIAAQAIPVRSERCLPRLGTSDRSLLSLLAYRLLSRLSLLLPHATTSWQASPLFVSSLGEGTGPGKLPRTGDLSTGKLSDAPPLGLWRLSFIHGRVHCLRTNGREMFATSAIIQGNIIGAIGDIYIVNGNVVNKET